jgi:hypothetical protein
MGITALRRCRARPTSMRRRRLRSSHRTRAPNRLSPLRKVRLVSLFYEITAAVLFIERACATNLVSSARVCDSEVERADDGRTTWRRCVWRSALRNVARRTGRRQEAHSAARRIWFDWSVSFSRSFVCNSLLSLRHAERKKAMAAFERECATMRSLPAHRNVLAVVGMCDDPPALITEFCAGKMKLLLLCVW